MRKNPECFLASSDGQKPRVRVITLFQADEKDIIFVTGKQKDLFKQLSSNPSVELLFWNTKQKGQQIRVCGSVELSDDLELKKKIVGKFTFLKPFVEKEGYDTLAPFYLKNGKAFVWKWEKELESKDYIDL